MSQLTTDLSKWKGRYMLLAVNSILGFAGYYNNDIPSALQVEIQGKYIVNCTENINATCCAECLGLGPDRYNELYAIFQWMNAAIGLPAGIIVDRLGNRVGAIMFTSFTLFGSFSFAFGTSNWFRRTGAMYPLMMTGRLLLGAGVTSVRSNHWSANSSVCMGGPNVEVVQDRVVTFWFSDRLEFAWGFTVSTFRIGTVLNFLVTANIASYYGLDVATWVGAAVSTVGFLSSIVLVCLDVYGSKKVDVYAKCKKDKKQFSFRRICEFTPSYWLTTAILVTFYSNFIPFVANGGQWIHDKYGIPKTTASYINGISSDVPVILSPIVGALLTRTGGRGTAAMFGSFLVLPMYLLVLYSYITPVVTSLLFGIAYVFVAVSLWPAITASVPLELVGTAIGLTNVFGGLCTGLSSLGIGKLLEHLSKIHGDNSLENWNIAMLILLGIEALSLGASVSLSVKEAYESISNRRRRKTKTVNEKDPLLN